MPLKEIDADLHLHGCFAGGVSKSMLVPIIAEQARLKGLQLLSTGDATHGKWLNHLEQNLSREKKCFVFKEFDVKFVLGGEINDENRVHHIYFLPNFDSAYELRNALQKYGKLDGIMMGRPDLRLNGEKLVEIIDAAVTDFTKS